MFVTLKEQKTYCKLKELIRELENSPIVSYVSLTFKGDKFTEKTDMVREGYIRVGAFRSFLTVKVKDILDLSFLYDLEEEMNTKIMLQVGSWFYLRSDKNSKGNAMQMANHFHETGKFLCASPGLICEDLKINP